MAEHPWLALWQARTVQSDATGLESLLAAGGYDSGFARVEVQDWRDAVGRRIAELGLSVGDDVYEVGCGAGAFLHECDARGLGVAGLDPSGELVALAGRAIPSGRFTVGEATDLAPGTSASAVVCVGAFLYFPSLDYAQRVIGAMASGARRAVAIYDLPDEQHQEADLARRVELSGGPEAYEQRYRGLDHRYYRRDWVIEQMRSAGLRDVHVASQDLAGYGNAPYRFNAWGFKDA